MAHPEGATRPTGNTWHDLLHRKMPPFTPARPMLTKLRLCNDANPSMHHRLHFLKFVIGK